ncbi:MAG: sigma-70 family RNA polymerase sigma factor [Chitinophagaceae bacterium]|nr:MAG: sigma-70 family RNA polymerase sigma factor [Chitinophagaceae bacterium]
MDAKVRVSYSPDDYWKALKGGDGKALEQLYRQHADALYNYGSRFTSDKEQVLECIQSLFVTIWTRRSNLGSPANVRNYLFKALRVALFKNNKLQLLRDRLDQDGKYNFLATISIEEEMILEEDRVALQQRLQLGLDQLSSRQREAVFLRFYEGMEYAEIAQVMDITTKGTYKLMARAIEVLRTKLDKADFSTLFVLFSFKLFG